ncbi:MAG TPA: GAF domain-containing protein [Gemmatimonadota bacterium]|nr:GAF domain-containing protein [Gemmatimonadota bacterium]
MDGGKVVETLDAARRGGASRDELLRLAVHEIEAAEDRYDWVGIYLLDDSTLVLHDYIGKPTDHDRIPVGQGVCGTAVAERRDVNVPDVQAIDNYLACSLETRSELVVLIRDGEDGPIHGQIDMDSDRPSAFGPEDEREIRRVAGWLAGTFDGDSRGGS